MNSKKRHSYYAAAATVSCEAGSIISAIAQGHQLGAKQSIAMTESDPDQRASREASDFASLLAPRWQAALGSDLLGVYLLGSLSHGGFSRRYSDIDMLVMSEAGVSQPVLEKVRGEAIALSDLWGRKVSVFWTDRQFRTGRFPPLDRIDYLERPVLLLEHERVMPARPTLTEIRRYLSGTPLANWTANANRFAAATALDPADRKAYLRALLYPARFCFSYLTGRMSSNDDAVAFLREQKVPGLDFTSIERALACRQAAADPDPLFSDRALLPAQVKACASLIASELALIPR